MQPTIPQSVAALLPFLATALSSWLSHSTLKPALNALIAFVALVSTAVASAYLAGNFTGNLQASILVVLAYVVFLMQNDFKTLLQFLVSVPSILNGFTQASTPIPARASRISNAAPAKTVLQPWNANSATPTDGNAG